MSPLVVFVGPPGSGKTTVGRLVAASRGVEFRDTDDDVARAAGSSVADIFVDQGEEVFRALEREAVALAVSDHSGVLALGGGAVIDADTRTLLRDQHVVFLSVGLGDAASRVGLNRDRPLLLGNPRQQLRLLLEQRKGFYDEVASVTVVTDGRTPQEIADEILVSL